MALQLYIVELSQRNFRNQYCMKSSVIMAESDEAAREWGEEFAKKCETGQSRKTESIHVYPQGNVVHIHI